jgi:hypothetical protein
MKQPLTRAPRPHALQLAPFALLMALASCGGGSTSSEGATSPDDGARASALAVSTAGTALTPNGATASAS